MRYSTGAEELAQWLRTGRRGDEEGDEEARARSCARRRRGRRPNARSWGLPRLPRTSSLRRQSRRACRRQAAPAGMLLGARRSWLTIDARSSKAATTPGREVALAYELTMARALQPVGSTHTSVTPPIDGEKYAPAASARSKSLQSSVRVTQACHRMGLRAARPCVALGRRS